MGEESLVARLRALEAILSRAADLRVHVENDPLWLVEYGHVEDAVGEAADALERAEKERSDLAMLIKRMIYRATKSLPLNEILAQADDYLSRKDLYGSPLRIDAEFHARPKDETP